MAFYRWYNRTLNRIWGFIEDRTAMRKWALRPQPQFTFKPSYWTGAFVAVAFIYQILSGALLLLYYQPSVAPTLTLCGQTPGTFSIAPAAWCSTYYIVNSVPMGSLLLTSHLYGAYAMIFLMFVHFYRGYYLGVYKAPREFSWMVGTLLMVVTLGMGFTGYLLPYTALSYDATNVGVVLAIRLTIPTPWGALNVGTLLAPFILGDGTAQGLLSRMFVAHVLLLPLALGALLYAHIALFESHGIAPQSTSDPLQRRRYTERDDEKHVPFMPHIFFYMTKWALLYVGVLFALAALWPWTVSLTVNSWYGNTAVPTPPIIPDWYFLWLFKLLDFQGVTPVLAITLVTVLILYVLFLPWLDRSKRTHPRDRPVFIYIVTCLLQLFIILSVWGQLTPGVQIPPMQVAATVGPMFLVNAVVLALFYGRYRASYRRRLDAQRIGFAGRYPAPLPGGTAPSPTPVAGPEVKSSD